MSAASPDRYPMLADQVRCATGATYVTGGRLRAMSGGGAAARRAWRDAAPGEACGEPPPSEHWLYLRLHNLAARGAALPSSAELGRHFGVTGYVVGYQFTRLVAEGLIDMAVRRTSCGSRSHRVVRLRQTGAVLRSVGAPDDMEV